MRNASLAASPLVGITSFRGSESEPVRDAANIAQEECKTYGTTSSSYDEREAMPSKDQMSSTGSLSVERHAHCRSSRCEPFVLSRLRQPFDTP